MLTVDDLAVFLNLTLADKDGEADPRRPELQDHLDAALRTVEARTGPVYTREAFWTARPRGGLLLLPAVRLQAITSIVGPTGVLDLDDLPAGSVDLAAGMIHNLPRQHDGQPFVVTAQAGAAEPPADLARAVLYVAGHLWNTQRGRSQRPGVLGEERTGSTAWAIPYAAQTLMEPYLLPLDARSA